MVNDAYSDSNRREFLRRTALKIAGAIAGGTAMGEGAKAANLPEGSFQTNVVPALTGAWITNLLNNIEVGQERRKIKVLLEDIHSTRCLIVAYEKKLGKGVSLENEEVLKTSLTDYVNNRLSGYVHNRLLAKISDAITTLFATSAGTAAGITADSNSVVPAATSTLIKNALNVPLRRALGEEINRLDGELKNLRSNYLFTYRNEARERGIEVSEDNHAASLRERKEGKDHTR